MEIGRIYYEQYGSAPEALFENACRSISEKKDAVEKGYFWGLLLFVGIPLPGTGAWTGALIASMLNIPFKKAFPAILLGVIIATVIVGLLVWGLLDPVIALFAHIIF